MSNKLGILLMATTLIVGLLLAGCSDESSVSLMSPEDSSTTIYESPEAGGDLNFGKDSRAGTTINCQGQRCTMPGETILPGYVNRDYSYIITPGSGDISVVEFGVNANFSHKYNISMVVMPQGWDYVYVEEDTAASSMRLRHGFISQPTENNSKIIRFYGPAMGDTFQIAFKSNFNPKAVEWNTSDGSTTDWDQPCGHGYGPVHSPFGFRVTGLYQGPGDIVPAPEPGPLH